jgi:hypothetical protein
MTVDKNLPYYNSKAVRKLIILISLKLTTIQIHSQAAMVKIHQFHKITNQLNHQLITQQCASNYQLLNQETIVSK